MFVNGILLSVAEAISAGLTGWALVECEMTDTVVFRLCALLSITFNQHFGTVKVTLFSVAMLGFGTQDKIVPEKVI